MIICSCHVVSDREVLQALSAGPRRMSEVYDALGHVPHCGRCTHTVRAIMRDAGQEFGARESACCQS
jgi:bacterioferritin-associated ferredoxin